jgi:hypothetical protein
MRLFSDKHNCKFLRLLVIVVTFSFYFLASPITGVEQVKEVNSIENLIVSEDFAIVSLQRLADLRWDFGRRYFVFYGDVKPKEGEVNKIDK